MDSEDQAVVVAWTGILVTLAVSVAQGLVFYVFFAYRRSKDKAKYESTNDSTSLDLYETRHHTRSHRSPEPFGSGLISEALGMNDEATLKCVGLDSFMYLRLLRLGASICAIGAVLAVLLMPVYATGGNRGNGTLQFNCLTLVRVEPGEHWRLWVTAGAWCAFVAAVLHLFCREWALFYKNRQHFLASGDEDMIPDYRYTVRVEQVEKNSNSVLRSYFERLFPGKVVAVASCLQTNDLEALVALRHKVILALEAADAFIHANPSKPPPTTMVCFRKVDAQQHYQTKLASLNEQIDDRRAKVLEMSEQNDTQFQQEGSDASGTSRNKSIETTTAFVTFATLGTKEAAIQCELNGDPDALTVFPASDPQNTIWSNCAISLRLQKLLEFSASLFWTTGVLFWSIPVAFVAAISNLNSILKTFNVKSVDETSALYGLVSGLLPVVALAILMALLFMDIRYAATSFIRTNRGQKSKSTRCFGT